QDWLERIATRVTADTYDIYESTLRCHLVPYFGQKHLGAISRHDVDDYLTHKVTDTRRGRKGARVPLAAATVNKHLAVLKFVLKDAIEHGLLVESSALHAKYVRRPDDSDRMHILQPEEIDRLLQAATGDEPWRTLYLLAVHTGLR